MVQKEEEVWSEKPIFQIWHWAERKPTRPRFRSENKIFIGPRTNPYCWLWFSRRSWLMLAQCHIWCLSQLNVFTQDQNFAQECTTQGKEQEQENKPKHDPFTNTSWLLASSPPFLHLKPSQLGHQYRQRADTFACHLHPDACSGCFQESFTYTMMHWCLFRMFVKNFCKH